MPQIIFECYHSFALNPQSAPEIPNVMKTLKLL